MGGTDQEKRKSQVTAVASKTLVWAFRILVLQVVDALVVIGWVCEEV